MVDTNHREAADAIRNLARLFKHMEGAADALESVANMDQVKREKLKAIADLESEVVAKKKAVAVQNGKIDSAKDDADLIISTAKAEAEGVLASARLVAEDMKNAAANVALVIKSDAAASGERLIAQARFTANEHAGKSNELIGTNQRLFAEIEAMNAERTRLIEAIAAVRATMAQIMGGAQ